MDPIHYLSKLNGHLSTIRKGGLMFNPSSSRQTNLKDKKCGEIPISSQSWKLLDQSKRLTKSCESPLQSGMLFRLVPVFEGWLGMCDTLFANRLNIDAWYLKGSWPVERLQNFNLCLIIWDHLVLSYLFINLYLVIILPIFLSINQSIILDQRVVDTPDLRRPADLQEDIMKLGNGHYAQGLSDTKLNEGSCKNV